MSEKEIILIHLHHLREEDGGSAEVQPEKQYLRHTEQDKHPNY